MLETVNPESVGFSPERLDRLNHRMHKFVDDKKLSGVVTLIARHGKIAHMDAYGMRVIESQKPMEIDTLFSIYSMTKPLTSVAAMMLFEEGRFQLDDPISAYIPAFEDAQVYAGLQNGKIKTEPSKTPITIHQLFTHTSGLTNLFNASPPIAEKMTEAALDDPKIELAERMRRLAQIPLMFHPGERWHYSLSTDVLAALVEVLSGMSFADFLKERIFDPLEMNETQHYVEPANIDRLAHIYDEHLTPVTTDKTSQHATKTRNIRGASGLASTITDYAQFCQMMLNKGELNGVRFLSPYTIELMTANHLRPDQMPYVIQGESGDYIFHGYGFGLLGKVVMNVAQTKLPGSVGQYGWDGAAGTRFWIDPSKDLFAILMAQYSGSEILQQKDYFRTMVYQALVE